MFAPDVAVGSPGKRERFADVMDGTLSAVPAPDGELVLFSSPSSFTVQLHRGNNLGVGMLYRKACAVTVKQHPRRAAA